MSSTQTPRFTVVSRWRSHFLTGLLFAAAATAAALGIRLILGDLLVGAPFLTFFPAIALTVYICGSRAGWMAVAFSAATSWYFVGTSVNIFTLLGRSSWLALAVFVMVAAMIVALTAALQRSLAMYTAAVAERDRLNEELDERVQQRTLELESVNRQLVSEAQIRAAAESQVRQMQKMEAVGQLTGGIAHDFNNMLAIIVGSLDLARRNLPERPEKARSQVENALEGAKRAAELTARLLAFSRQQALEPKVLDVNRLVSDMSEMLTRILGEAIRFETVLAGGVWTMFADAAQVQSAILNLCVNSRDAMPEGGRLTLETMNSHLDDRYAATNPEARPGQYVQIAVTDSGTGMSEAVAARAFDPFYTTKATGKGSGLGLSQVYGFVKQSGGHIKIYSEPGQGTTVRIYLPRYTGTAAVADVVDAQSEAGTSRAKGEAILVVEDDPRVRKTIVGSLLELGYTVLEAGDAAQALAMANTDAPIALLFTDIVMPDINGRVLAEQIKLLRPPIKVLYTTGYTRNAVIHNGIVDAGIDLISKPFTVEELAVKIRSVLDN